MMRANQKGRTMIEVIAVLSILGVLTANIAGMVMSMFQQYKYSIIQNQIRDLRKSVNARYAARGSYTGLNIKTLIDERLVPYNMVNGNKLRQPFGGDVTLSSADYGGRDRSYTITFTKVPERACVELSTLNWQIDNTSTLVSLDINATKFVWPINRIGSGDSVDHEQIANALPVTSQKVFGLCTKKEDNTLIWEFQ